MHPQNRGYKVFATNGKAAVITSTSDLAPGGATQLYLDKRFDRPIVRQLTVREAHSVMGKPFSLDTSAQDREEKLRILGQSEDGYLARAWARKVKQYAANESDEVRLSADSGLHWTKEAHARCLHYGDWCLNLLGLAALKDNCKECALAGLKRTAKSTARQTPVPEVNYRWGCDIIGKMRPKEKGKNVMQYSLVVIDYHSNKVWNRNYHSKSETLSKFKEIMHAAKHEAMPDEIQCGDHPLVSESIKDYCKDHKIKVLGPSKLGPHKLRADSDSVFKSEAYQKLCEKHSIGQEFSSPGDQFYNGKVERAIGTLKRKMHTVLKASGLSMQYWPEALDYCVYVYNRLPCSANLLNLSPFHMYTGRPPHIGHLRAFGCTCTYRVDKNAEHGSGHDGLFLGFSKQCPRGTYLIEVKGKRKECDSCEFRSAGTNVG
jgi:transposase InsO family protein